MFSTRDIKKAIRVAREQPGLEPDDIINQLTNEVDIADIELIVDTWNEQTALPTVRKKTAPIRKEISTGIRNFGVDECVKAIKHYNQMLSDEGYFFKHRWKIELFFKQDNALPEFLDDGSKWMNYVAERLEGQQKKWRAYENITDPLTSKIVNRAATLFQAFTDKYKDITPVSVMCDTPEEYDREKEKSWKNAAIKYYPIIFAKVCRDEMVFIKDPLSMRFLNTDQQFRTEYEKVIVVDKNGRTIRTHNIEESFNKLNL